MALTKVKNVIDITADTMADLLSMQHKTGSVQLLGYHERGDGGGGVFFWDAAQDKANHNGGTIIDPDVVFPTDWNNQGQLATWFTAGSGAGCWVREHSGAVNVKWFGAKGDGVTDDTKSIQSSIAFSNHVHFHEGVFLCSEVELPSRDSYVQGDYATLQGTAGSYIFRQVDRGFLFKCTGLIFTGNSKAFFYDSNDSTLPSYTQNYEFLIEGCRFLQTSAVVAIHLYGSREGVISGCYFEGNDGIRIEAGAINTKITDCQFRSCNYGIYSLLTPDVANPEGVIISGVVMLGCSYGIRADRTTGVQVCNSMIDYCDSPIYLKGASSVIITGNYISTRTSSPAVYATDYSTYRGNDHVVSENKIIDNYSTTGSSCVRYENTDFFTISNNILKNYASYGFVLDSCTQGDIHSNITIERSGLGTNSLLTLLDDVTIRVYNNRFTQVLSRTHNTSTWDNSGFKTESSGECVITTDNSSVVVVHNLSITPSKNLITLTPTTPNTGSFSYYVSAVTSTTFTVTLNGAVASTTAFAWTVRSR